MKSPAESRCGACRCSDFSALSPSRHAHARTSWRFIGAVLAIALWTSAASASTPASQYFDLSHWKLTVPVNGSGGIGGVADELPSARLVRYSSPWFQLGQGGRALVFWAPVSGATTSGSDYPRSELREVLDPGNDNVNWTLDDKSVLQAKCMVQQVPDSTGKVVVGQIHGFQVNPLVKLVYHYSDKSRTGSVYALIDPTPHSKDDNVTLPLASDIGLNQAFSYEIDASSGGLKMRVNDRPWVTYDADPSWDDVGLYFKAGVYVQASGASSTDGGKVAFYRLVATHPNHGLAVSTPSLDNATAGHDYSQTLSHSGGSGDVHWSVVNGVLPDGLDLSAGGTLTGKPGADAAGDTYYFTLLATDAAGDTAAKNYALAVKS